MEQTMNMKRMRRFARIAKAPPGRKKTMLTFAIALLFAAGAAFALLVIVGMLAGNRGAILSALAGYGAFGAAACDVGSNPPQAQARVRIGPVRRGLGQSHRAANSFGMLRAAA